MASALLNGSLMHFHACRHLTVLSVLGISCTSILLVSVLGAVVEDPARHRLPLQVRQPPAC